MLDSVLKARSVKFRICVKSAIGVALVALSVLLPQLTHAIGGAQAGSTWMPMYLPALLAGCLLGWQWGLGVGIIAPIVSFGFTTLAFGEAMPMLSRLPYMTLELAAFGGVSGAFASLIRKNALYSFPAVLAAQIAGRAVYFVYGLIAGRSFSALFDSATAGLAGLYAQAR